MDETDQARVIGNQILLFRQRQHGWMRVQHPKPDAPVWAPCCPCPNAAASRTTALPEKKHLYGLLPAAGTSRERRAGEITSEDLFSYTKNFNLTTAVFLFYLVISFYYGLIRFKKFVSRFITKLCN